MSQPASQSPPQPPWGRRSSARMQALTRQAEINANPTLYTIKNWLAVAERREEEADAALKSGNFEQAYVKYLQLLIIVVETIPKHRDFLALERSKTELYSQYIIMKARMPEVASSLEHLKKRLESDDAEESGGASAHGKSHAQGLSTKVTPTADSTPARATFGNVGSGISKRITSLFGENGGAKSTVPSVLAPPRRSSRKESRDKILTPALPPRTRTGSSGSASAMTPPPSGTPPNAVKNLGRANTAEDVLHSMLNSAPPPPSTPPLGPMLPAVPSVAWAAGKAGSPTPVPMTETNTARVSTPNTAGYVAQDEGGQHPQLQPQNDQHDVGEAEFLARFPPLSDVHRVLDTNTNGVHSPTSTATLPAPLQNSAPAAWPQQSGRSGPSFPPTFEFGPTSVIEPQQFYSFLAGDYKDGQKPSMLIFDLRSPQEFALGSILDSLHGRCAGERKGESNRVVVINIDPVTLRDGITSEGIDDSLMLAPEFASRNFGRRNEFDLVVYFDQSSTAAGRTRPTANLADAIYKMEFSKPLHRPPVLLLGGWAGWEEFLRVMNGPSTSEAGKLIDRTNQAGSSMRPCYSTERLLPDQKRTVGGDVENMKLTSGPIIHRSLEDYFQRPRSAQSMRARTSMHCSPSSPVYSQQYPGNQYPSNVPMPPTPSQPPMVPGQSSMAAAQTLSEPLRSKRITFLDDPNFGFAKPVPIYPSAPPTVSVVPHQIPRHPPTPQFLRTPPLLPRRPLPAPPEDAHLRLVPARQQLPAALTPPLPPSSSASSQGYSEQPQTLNLQSLRPTMPTHPPPTVPTPPCRAYGSDQHVLARQRSFSIRRVGLKNLGNTCFMNSVIQCLSGTRPLARYFLDGSYKRHINRSNKLGTGGVLTEAFAELIRQMWSDQGTYIIPAQFRDAVSHFHAAFASNDQQDSQEFLAFLLDKIHEDVNLAPRHLPPPRDRTELEEDEFERLPDQEAAETDWQRYLTRNDSVVVKMFQGQLKNRMRCETCGRTSTTYNPFMFLSVPIVASKKGKPVELTACLDDFVKTEVLDGAEQWSVGGKMSPFFFR